ncbi:MAG: hypothetical protein NWE89_16105 [Candidatus Bathyarchaeota archaeon]|nr:hypothetical protein [Candidatus Bathyarchaeota archaeon]
MDAQVLVNTLSKLEANEWVTILNTLTQRLKRKQVWTHHVEPQLQNIQQNNSTDPETLIQILEIVLLDANDVIEEAQMYRLLPKTFREFLETNGEAVKYFGFRLLEAVQAHHQITEIQTHLKTLSKAPYPVCEQCEHLQATEAIRQVTETIYSI